MSALRKANRIRSGKAQVKREMRAGVKSLMEGLADPACASARVWEIMVEQPSWGAVKVGKLLNRVGVNPNKRVDGLSPRQKVALIAAVEDRRLARELAA
jgi:hypothetical protein